MGSLQPKLSKTCPILSKLIGLPNTEAPIVRLVVRQGALRVVHLAVHLAVLLAAQAAVPTAVRMAADS